MKTAIYPAILSLLFMPLVGAVFISDLPSCFKDCITSSGDLNCALTDIGCICRASNGNFLPDVVTCFRANCDDHLSANVFLTPLQFACQLFGAPISSQALRDAQVAATNVVQPATVTATATATVSVITAPTAVITTTTIAQKSTVSVEQSTYTTRDLNGSTRTVIGTLVTSTTVAGPRTTGSASSNVPGATTSSSQAAATGASTNSSPFGTQNAGARRKEGSWMRMSMLAIGALALV